MSPTLRDPAAEVNGRSFARARPFKHNVGTATRRDPWTPARNLEVGLRQHVSSGRPLAGLVGEVPGRQAKPRSRPEARKEQPTPDSRHGTNIETRRDRFIDPRGVAD